MLPDDRLSQPAQPEAQDENRKALAVEAGPDKHRDIASCRRRWGGRCLTGLHRGGMGRALRRNFPRIQGL